MALARVGAFPFPLRQASSIALLVALAGCRAPKPAAADPCGAEPHPVVIFRPVDGHVPAFGEVPFPSDLYRAADGTLVDEIPGLSRIAENPEAISRALSVVRGFGRTTAAYFFVSRPVDAATLDGAAFFVNVDRASKGFGKTTPAIARYLASTRAIAALPHPGMLLDAGARYAAVLTTRAAHGSCPVAADVRLQKTLGALAAPAQPGIDALNAEALAALVELKAATPQQIAGLTVFTTQSGTEDMVAVARTLQDRTTFPEPKLLTDPLQIAPYKPFFSARSTDPTLDEWLGVPIKDEAGRDWPGTENKGGMAHDTIGAVLTGAFEAPTFLDPATDHFSPDDGSAPPKIVGKWLIPVTFVLPRGAPPAKGWPVVVYGHGLSASRQSLMPIANEFTRKGFALAGIDVPFHGTRDGIADLTNEYPGTWKGADGFPDASGNNFRFFAGFQDPIAIRDHFRQAVADQLSLVRLVTSSALDLGPAAAALGFAPKLDATNVFWCGQSLGGMIGTMTAAYAPEFRAVALAVPGAGFIHLLAGNSALFTSELGPLLIALVGVKGTDRFDSFHPVANLVATAVEGGDPLVHAAHLVREPLPLGPGGAASRHHLLISYALDDEVMPNRSTSALLLAAGVPLLTPALVVADDFGAPFPVAASPVSGNVPGATVGAIQHAPANHNLLEGRFTVRNYRPGGPNDSGDVRFPLLPAQITVEEPIRQVLSEISTFFTGALDGKVPAIAIEAPPRADFDGDGVTDDEELRKGTDPLNPQSR